ncbi:hypothetical protein I551_1675 [Mycobacterium ulcerans str. Harvey]|uniref:Secreted protein n=1 Tax=Mycobacterium ulcerans str. Harvey TaxID=1299332 RepID=A0ABP3AKV2_MYCUL|nr:hypothetical protein I551_1675 [Mycobacterium ulcerans str. Harvey]
MPALVRPRPVLVRVPRVLVPVPPRVLARCQAPTRELRPRVPARTRAVRRPAPLPVLDPLHARDRYPRADVRVSQARRPGRHMRHRGTGRRATSTGRRPEPARLAEVIRGPGSPAPGRTG